RHGDRAALPRAATPCPSGTWRSRTGAHRSRGGTGGRQGSAGGAGAALRGGFRERAAAIPAGRRAGASGRSARLGARVAAARGPDGMGAESARIELLRVAVRVGGHVLERSTTLTGDGRAPVLQHVAIPVLAAARVRHVDLLDARQLVGADAM